MKYRTSMLVLAFAAVASAGIQPSFWLSKCAWDASDVIELGYSPDEGRFFVAASIKGGGIEPGAITALSLLLPPSNERALLKDLTGHCDLFGRRDCRQNPPPMRERDRVIVFLRQGGQPAGMTMLTSAVWLQNGKAYVFEQNFNPGPSHLEEFHPPSQPFNGIRFEPGSTEAMARSDIAQMLRWRASFDHAISNPDAHACIAELAELVTSKDRVVVQATLARLTKEGPAAAHALRPYLDDDNLLFEHFEILDAIAASKGRDVRLDSIINKEQSYWTSRCDLDLGSQCDRNFGEPSTDHYLRLVSALKAIHALGVDEDVPAVLAFAALVDHCKNLKDQQELRDVISSVLAK